LTDTENTQIKSSNSLISDIKSLLPLLLFLVTLRIFVFGLFYVPTPSMSATILGGDYVFSTHYNYGYSIYSLPFSPDIFKGRVLANQPERGDVVIMRPPHDMDIMYIKRLIGLPGEKVQIIDDVTYINDEPIKRVEVGNHTDEYGVQFIKFKETMSNGTSFFSYKMKHPNKQLGLDQSNFGPYLVEEGHYFFMGDNRDGSGDSRYQLGNVPFRNLISKGHLVLFSIKEPLWDAQAGFFEQIGRIWTWISSIRFNRIANSLYEE